MGLLLWLLVPLGYALGVLLADVGWRVVYGSAPAARMGPALDSGREPIALRTVDGVDAHAWG